MDNNNKERTGTCLGRIRRAAPAFLTAIKRRNPLRLHLRGNSLAIPGVGIRVPEIPSHMCRPRVYQAPVECDVLMRVRARHSGASGPMVAGYTSVMTRCNTFMSTSTFSYVEKNRRLY